MKLLKCEPAGKLECFCVSTDTGHYDTNGLTSHNSVMLQNVVIHCIEHRDHIALGLIDIKQVEFSNYKGMNGIVGVANSVKEACELLRIARIVMYKRNKEMAKLGIKSLTDYEPTQRSGKVYVTGREYNEDDEIKVRIDGEEKMMLAKDLVEYLKEN